MSINGPSPLGTLLVQRLDAALGTTLAQQANLVSGARPDAVTQPGQTNNLDPVQNATTRHPRETVDRSAEQTGQQLRQATSKAKLDAQQALLSSRAETFTSSTGSAPTTLGGAAKAILALLNQYPERAPALRGRAPLTDQAPQAPADGKGQARQGNAAPATGNDASPRTPGSPQSTPDSLRGGEPAGSTIAGARGGQPTTPAGMPAGPATGPQAVTTQSAPSSLPAQLAQALANAMQGSGLFYESHLSSLTFGKYDIAALRQEPQAGLSAEQRNTPGPAPSDATQRPSSETSSSTAGSSHTSSTQAGTSPALAALHPDSHLLVRQQLETLANQAIVWRGEAWPDAPMEWEIHREQPEPGRQGQDPDHWATTLTLTLPALGQIQARLNLVGDQLLIRLAAPESAPLLNGHREDLKTRMLSTGLQINAMTISTEAEDAPAETDQ